MAISIFDVRGLAPSSPLLDTSFSPPRVIIAFRKALIAPCPWGHLLGWLHDRHHLVLEQRQDLAIARDLLLDHRIVQVLAECLEEEPVKMQPLVLFPNYCDRSIFLPTTLINFK